MTTERREIFRRSGDCHVATHDNLRLGLLSSVLIFLFVTISASCSHQENAEEDEGVLLRFNDTILTMLDVESRIPVGLDPSDSAALFSKIVDDWIESEVISSLARTKLPDMGEIEQKVANYRKRLIVTEYLRRMGEGRDSKVDEDSIRFFYETHKSELLTESPLVKGIYIKVSSTCPGLEEIKGLVAGGSDDDIDLLEKKWVGEAIQYDYFGSTWVDWQTISDQIPYRFYDPDAFLRNTKDFETSYNGFTYIFHISDYLPVGSVQPYEFASRQISAMMERVKLSNYQEALVESLVKKAIRDKELEPVGYDPIRKRLTEPVLRK